MNRGGLHWSRSLRFRLLAVTVAGLTVAVVLAGLVLSGLFREHVQRQFEAALLLQLDQVTARLEFDGQGGTSTAESLALFGLPLSPPLMEQNADGGTYLTQYFERARFEYHPENAATPYAVLLGLLGREQLQRGQ